MHVRRLLPLVLAALGSCSYGAGADQRPRSALLVTLDTTRADALGCYGGRPGLTPQLDRLAAEGVRYDSARTVTPLTLPSHASMLTGLLPPRHTLRDNGIAPLPASARTLAEVAREHGLATAAIVAASALDRAFALDQGFDVYRQPQAPPGGAGGYVESTAPEVVAAARNWLAGLDGERPFFLWVHLFDPHTPYLPSPAALARAGGDPYLGEVAVADEGVGALLDALRASGRLDETLVIVLADHGEALGEHGEPTHGVFCYEATIRIPFLVRWPDGRRAGEVSQAQVSAVDVFPTVVEALGLGEAGAVDGLSLAAGDPPAGREAYFESYSPYLNHGWSPLAGWSDGRLKYLASSEPELYDLQDDPAETRDLVAERGADVARARGTMTAWLRRPALERGASARVPEELLRGLRQLGYGATGGVLEELPSPLEPSTRPSPRARAADLVPFERANELITLGRFGEAAELLRDIESRNPASALTLDVLAFALMQTGEWGEAAAVLERRQPLGVPRCDSLTSLGACYEAQGDWPLAQDAYQRALAVDDAFVPAMAGLARALIQQGRAPEAQPWIERLQAQQTGR